MLETNTINALKQLKLILKITSETICNYFKIISRQILEEEKVCDF